MVAGGAWLWRAESTSEPLDVTAAGTAEPEWFARCPARLQLVSQVRTFEAPPPAATLFTGLGRERSQALFADEPQRWVVHLTRTLLTGHTFESELDVTLNPSGEELELTAAVVRANGSPTTYEITLTAAGVSHVRLTTEEGSREIAPGAGLPFGVGDLQVRDVLKLAQAARDGELTPLGTLAGLGSDELLVFEADFTRDAPVAEDPPHDAVAYGALVYVHPATLRPSAVRVIDAHERVVRVLEDFSFDGLRLTSFRATSLMDGSHSIFRLQVD